MVAEFELHPRAPGLRDRCMKIVPTQVTGRAVSRHREPSPSGHVSYMPLTGFRYATRRVHAAARAMDDPSCAPHRRARSVSPSTSGPIIPVT